MWDLDFGESNFYYKKIEREREREREGNLYRIGLDNFVKTISLSNNRKKLFKQKC